MNLTISSAPPAGEGFLGALGITDVEDAHAIGRAWNIAEAEIAALAKTALGRTASESLEVEAAIAALACGAERALLNRGRVLTQSVLDATDEQLLSFIDYYETELLDLYRRMREREELVARQDSDREWADCRLRFERLSGFLWECRTRSGVWAVTHPEETA